VTTYAPSGLHAWALELFANQSITISPADIANNCLALPYWAWEHDAGLPAATRKFAEPSTFGTSGACVTDGMAKFGNEVSTNWRIAGSPTCLKRSYNILGNVNAGSVAMWANAMNDVGFCNFRFTAEGSLHVIPHGYVSGTMGSIGTAGREFLFYLHHNNVDRLWHEWQQVSPANKYDFSNCGVSGRGLNDPMPPFDGVVYPEATPNDVINHAVYKHKCKPSLYGPIISIPAAFQKTMFQIGSLKTSRTCYGAEFVAHGKKCSLIPTLPLSASLVERLSKVFKAGLGKRVPTREVFLTRAEQDQMFNASMWSMFGFSSDEVNRIRAELTTNHLSKEETDRWAPFFQPGSQRELVGGLPADWVNEGHLDQLVSDAEKVLNDCDKKKEHENDVNEMIPIPQ
jgi:hypothetical protein